MIEVRPRIEPEYWWMLAGVSGIAVMLVLMQRRSNTTAPRIATNNQAAIIASNTPTPTSYQPVSQGQYLYGRAK